MFTKMVKLLKMPRAKATPSSTPAAKKARAPKGHKLAETFPNGEILKDTMKKDWRLGDVIGQGGFGLIYRASDNISKPVSPNAPFVVKIEPKDNGPLFCELHFYQRAAKADTIDEWVKKKKLKYLPVPKLCGSGTHTRNTKAYRFLAIPRFSTDLQKLFEHNGKTFSTKTVYGVGLRMLDALEYLHENDYVHADVKAANILMGFKNGKTVSDQVYLVDFGLAAKYAHDGQHKEYKEDPKKAHDGTVEFTSRDSHMGVSPSRRADIEILGYCLLQWLCGVLPWEDKLSNKDYVRDCKIKYMKDIPSLMKKCFPDGKAPDTISMFLALVSKTKYEEKPNYKKFRDILLEGLKKVGEKDEWKLNISIDDDGGASSSTKKTPQKAVAVPLTKVKSKKRKSSDKSPIKSPVKSKKRKSSDKSPIKSPVKSENPVKSKSPAQNKAPSNLTPAQRQVLAKMNGANKASPANKAKKTATVQPKTVKSPTPVKQKANAISDSEGSSSSDDEGRSPAPRRKKTTKSPSPGRQPLKMEEDDISEDDDFEPTPKKAKSATPAKRGTPRSGRSETDESSPKAKGSAAKKGTKRVVRRKKNTAQVDASSQTSPAVNIKKKR